jgi:hypothetical protein
MALSEFPLTQDIIDRFSPVIPSLRGAMAGEMAQAGNELRSIQAAQAALAANPNANVDEIQRAIALALQTPPPAAPASNPQTVDQITATVNTALQDPTISTASRPVAPQQQQRGGGLLEMFGLQKMQPEAQGETGQKFYERDRFKDFSGTMANWLNSMTLNPDPNLAANMDAGKQRRTANKSRNRTVDMLTQKAESGDTVAAAVLSALNTGAITAKDAISTYLSQTLTDPKTQSQMFKRVMDARKEFSGRAEAKGFSEVSFAYGRIASAIQGGPTAAGDLSLIFNFMKMLDPGSVVRESEFSAAASAGSYGERIKALVGSIEEGTLLSAAQRADFVARATGLYNSAQSQYDKVANQYRDFAVQAGLDPSLVVPDISYAGELLKRPTILDVPPRPTTGAAATSFPTDEAWQKHWREGFTEQQRKDYLQALGN